MHDHDPPRLETLDGIRTTAASGRTATIPGLTGDGVDTRRARVEA